MLAAVSEDGDTRIVYRDLPVFGPVSEDAARVALALQPQGLYPRVHDAFMREGRHLSPEVMRGLVEKAGGDWDAAVETIAQGRASRQLDANRRDALLLGIRGTPTYVIGRYRYVGALSERQFRTAIDRARN